MATPPRRGDLGYADWCVREIEAGRCSCAGCSGSLTDPTVSPGGWGHCRSCGCAHKVEDRRSWRTAAWIPVVDQRRCRHADQVRATELREQRAAERRRQRQEWAE